MGTFSRFFISAILLLVASSGASALGGDDCSKIRNSTKRLGCYDSLKKQEAEFAFKEKQETGQGSNSRNTDALKNFVIQAQQICDAPMAVYVLPKAKWGSINPAIEMEAKQCIKDRQALMGENFEELKTRYAASPDTVKLLKDFYSTWLSLINVVRDGAVITSRPSFDGWEARIEYLSKQLATQGERLKLEQ